MPYAFKRTGLISTWCALLAGAVLSASGILHAASQAAAFSEAACDVTTGASVRVSGIQTTTTSATIAWTEGEHGSKRYFCLGTSPNPTTCALVQSRASGTKLQTATGLNSMIKYYYQFYGIHGGTTHKTIVNGSFTTDGSSCGSLVSSTVEVQGYVLTSGGDSLAKAKVTMAGTSTQTVSTNPSGHFQFLVSPGTYTLSVALPPFTPPTPYKAVVIANKPLIVPDLIMTGAFQISGAVVSSSNTADSLSGAIVVLKNGASTVATDTTDDNGLYSFVATNGTFSVSATYRDPASGAIWTMSTPPPTVSIAGKDIKVDALPVKTSVGILHPWYLQPVPGRAAEPGYDGKGVRVGNRTAHKLIFYR